jgi:hypothetical protein
MKLYPHSSHLYQVSQSLTHRADSRISVDVIRHGEQLLGGLPCLLQFRFARTLALPCCEGLRRSGSYDA